jgi:hypothetical protein
MCDDRRVLVTAKTQRRDPAEVLRVLLNEEVASRDRSSLATCRVNAAFSHRQNLLGLGGAGVIDAGPTQAALCTLEWIGRAENLVVSPAPPKALPGRRGCLRTPRRRSQFKSALSGFDELMPQTLARSRATTVQFLLSATHVRPPFRSACPLAHGRAVRILPGAPPVGVAGCPRPAT